MNAILIPPTISEDEKSPLVLQLLALIEHQGSIIQQQAEQIQNSKTKLPGLRINLPDRKLSPAV